MTANDKVKKELEKTCAYLESKHYPEDERADHPKWESYLNDACAALRVIIAASPTCPPDCGPKD